VLIVVCRLLLTVVDIQTHWEQERTNKQASKKKTTKSEHDFGDIQQQSNSSSLVYCLSSHFVN
jgi:hypothetical protein